MNDDEEYIHQGYYFVDDLDGELGRAAVCEWASNLRVVPDNVTKSPESGIFFLHGGFMALDQHAVKTLAHRLVAAAARQAADDLELDTEDLDIPRGDLKTTLLALSDTDSRRVEAEVRAIADRHEPETMKW